MQSMLQAGFTSNLVLYAASGLLTYGANDGGTSGHISATCVVLHLRFCALPSTSCHAFISPLLIAACWLQAALSQTQRNCLHCMPRASTAATDFMSWLAEMDNLIGSLKDAGLCKDVHYKELYIPQAELEGWFLETLSLDATCFSCMFTMLALCSTTA